MDDRGSESFAIALAVSLVLASVALAASVMTGSIGPSRDASTRESANGVARAQVGPPPLTGDSTALMLAKRSRDVLIGLAARRGGPVDLLPIPSDGTPVGEGSLRVVLDGKPTRLASCGEGCFRLAERVLAGSARTLAVEVARPGKPVAAVRFRLPRRLPAAAEELLSAAKRTMVGLGSVRVRESLTAGLGAEVRTRYEMLAPDRIRFETSTGGKTILIGRSRWDWEGGRWVRSPFPGTRAPNYPWEDAGRARLLGTGRMAGRPVRVVAVFKPDPQFPAWFRLFVARDARVLKSEMLTRAHFMIDRYSGFDEPLTIEPPE